MLFNIGKKFTHVTNSIPISKSLTNALNNKLKGSIYAEIKNIGT